MEKKQYEFYGVDFKTELLLGLMTGVILIAVWAGLVYSFYVFNDLDSVIRMPKRIFFGSMFLGVLISLLLLRVAGKYLKRKWKIIIENNTFIVEYKNIKYAFDLNDIAKIVLNGGNEMRYLTFITNKNKIRIRVGTNFLMPFSEKKDIEILDLFIYDIKKNLDKYFDKIDRTVSLSPEGTIKLIYIKR